MKIFFLIIHLIIYLNSYSCDCILNTVENDYNQADLVFTGKVIKVIEPITSEYYLNNSKNSEFYKNKGWKVLIKILANFKTETYTDTVVFSSKHSNCDPIYELNQEMIFFANYFKKDTLIMKYCSNWGKTIDSKETIEKIIKLKNKNSNIVSPCISRYSSMEQRFFKIINNSQNLKIEPELCDYKILKSKKSIDTLFLYIVEYIDGDTLEKLFNNGDSISVLMPNYKHNLRITISSKSKLYQEIPLNSIEYYYEFRIKKIRRKIIVFEMKEEEKIKTILFAKFK